MRTGRDAEQSRGRGRGSTLLDHQSLTTACLCAAAVAVVVVVCVSVDLAFSCITSVIVLLIHVIDDGGQEGVGRTKTMLAQTQHLTIGRASTAQHALAALVQADTTRLAALHATN